MHFVIHGFDLSTDRARCPLSGSARSFRILPKPETPRRPHWKSAFGISIAERYRNEEAVGDAMREIFEAGTVQREEVFVTTKLWNTNHRPERVRPAFEASLKRLQIDYADCYLIHTPYAFRPGDDQDPRDESGQVIYDDESR